MAGIWLIFWLANDKFLSPLNLTNLMLQIAALGTLAVSWLIAHSYAVSHTKGLLASLPEFGTPGEKLATFAGGVPDLRGDLTGCPFKERCPIGDEGCARETIEMREVAPGHLVRCRKVS